MPAMRGAFGLALTCAALAAGSPASAQKLFTRPIELVVPFSAGASTDLGARVLAGAMEARLGVPVRVVNKPGGNTVPAVTEMMRAEPDGSTLLVDSSPASSMLEIAVKNLPFKVSDRTFINIAAYTPMIFIVPADSPFKTLAEAAEGAKADPSTFSWTSLGGAGGQDYAARQFFKAVGVDVLKTRALQLKGGADAVTMTAGGHVRLGTGTYAAIAAPLQAKRLRVLAVSAAERWPSLPDAPTTVELGFKTVETPYWIGFSGPPRMPAQLVEAIDKAVHEGLADKAVLDGLDKIGMRPFYHDSAQMKARVEKERGETHELWAR
jgi:tripartite-type tricarboxylate transporter receptor subunit TctC